MSPAEEAAARLRALPPGARLVAAERERLRAEEAGLDEKRAHARRHAERLASVMADDLDSIRGHAGGMSVNGALTDEETRWARQIEHLAALTKQAAGYLRDSLEAR